MGEFTYRSPRPEDLYRLRVATEPRLSPDGRWAVVTLQTVAPGYDGYRTALWIVPTDGSAAPRQHSHRPLLHLQLPAPAHRPQRRTWRRPSRPPLSGCKNWRRCGPPARSPTTNTTRSVSRSCQISSRTRAHRAAKLIPSSRVERCMPLDTVMAESLESQAVRAPSRGDVTIRAEADR